MTLSASQFTEFYRDLWDQDPFPWQRMLADRVVVGDWPECLDLPTASGKTACIDIALFALACQAELPVSQRTAARRIFFVVDRRIVVDAAYQRAQVLSTKLRNANKGVLQKVADRLRSLHDGGDPLAVARVRGGMARNDGWVRSPAQPTVITATVDQVGSRLLFRAYGAGQRSAPIHAALVANDSLIILDEAHCAVPFFQTAKAVERYRGPEWAQHPIVTPFRVVVMSATPPAEAKGTFPSADERVKALAHPLLRKRLRAVKQAELLVAKKAESLRKGEPGLRGEALTDDGLVLTAADRAIRFAAAGSRRIAIMVNRVATVRAIYAQLYAETKSEKERLDADIVLMTGRMRPLDRDDLVERWASYLQAREKQPALARPVILVTTQCLEVGADFSFDALITECASLDALRQRFGRLDRFGTNGATQACVLIRPGQIKTEEQIERMELEGKRDDPIYGFALARTWNWLVARARNVAGDDGSVGVDFGIDAMDALLPGDHEERAEGLRPLVAPALNAPVMLPAHVDCWAQTAPTPRPDSDVAVFLHGPDRGEPEVHVVLRADLDATSDDEAWLEAVSLCPPSALEAFSVPLHVARAWIAGREQDMDAGGDVEGAEPEEDDLEGGRGRHVLLWRGRQQSRVTRDPTDLRPYDVMVVPASGTQVDKFGDVPPDLRGSVLLDVGDRAFLQVRNKPIIRVHAGVLRPWLRHPAVAGLLAWARGKEREEEEGDLVSLLSDLANAIESVTLDDGSTVPALPGWMRTAARALESSHDAIRAPDGAYVLTSKIRIREFEHPEEESDADEEDLSSGASRAVPLAEHLNAVAAVTRGFAGHCLIEDKAAAVVRAAQLHDLGKADGRFQVMLHGGNQLAALRHGELLAKSDGLPLSRSAGKRARQLAELPDGFRHEMLTVQAAETLDLVGERIDFELVLHLIASHHGHGRPLAPVVPDDDPPDVDFAELGIARTLTAQMRLDLPPPHRLDSGVAERFWRLTRRFGWWGLAYLEAILRLSDWEASERHEAALAKETSRAVEGVA